MATIQTTSDGLRFLRRKNLDEEARLVGGWYRDCIRQYGIDCVYHKMDMSEFVNFKQDMDRNAVLKRAYGYDITPEYTVNAHMVSFAEVDTDIFNLNKYGIQPQTDINLYFDSVQFACDLATKVGRYKEYPVEDTEIVCEVPEYDGDPNVWPYELPLGYTDSYKCSMLTGRFRCILSGYELDTETTVMCDPYEHTDFNVKFPQNSDLYMSLKYEIQNDDYLETMLYLTYKVVKVDLGFGKFKFVLKGRLHGSILFFDINELGKYTALIRPNVGDVVEIDFPDENNREKYDITDCFDKQLTQDGINPLLHKYIWKCKAKRHLEDDKCEGLENTEADRRLDERLKYDEMVDDEVAKTVEDYEDIDAGKGIKQDAVYGGYDGDVEQWDHMNPKGRHVKYDELTGGELMPVMAFGCGSALLTNGYDLIFCTADGEKYVVSKKLDEPAVDMALFESGLRWMKATDSQIVFVDIEGSANIIVFDEAADAVPELNINSLYESTVDTAGNVNRSGDDFLKFKGTRTFMAATRDRLYAKLQSNGMAYVIV